jgi:hypothetical protein
MDIGFDNFLLEGLLQQTTSTEFEKLGSSKKFVHPWSIGRSPPVHWVITMSSIEGLPTVLLDN